MNKILFVGPTAYGSADALLLLMRAFERENYQVRLISAHEDRPLGMDTIFRISRKATSWTISQFSRLVFSTAKRWRPDVVFLYGSNVWVSAQTIKKLQKNLGCKVVLWEVNNACFRGHQAESIPLYDHIFVLDSYLMPILRVNGAQRVNHLCACIDPEEHHPIELNAIDIERFGSDICLVGTAHPRRIEFLRNLTDYNLKIYGHQWGNDPILGKFISSDPVLDQTKLKIFSAAHISLNIHGPAMIHGENFRVFEVAACGGVSFSLPKPDLLQCFEPEKEVVLFENVGDLREKISYFLSHSDELGKIGIAAKERVLSEHTYTHRAKTILGYLTEG